MLFSGKENVFMCLVAFQKNFRKIFSGVWKRRRKRQSQQNTDKTQKKPRQKIINDRRSTRFDGAVLRELQSDDRAVDRAVVGLDGAISRRRDRDRRHDLAKARRSRLTSRDCDRRHDLVKHQSRSRKASRRSRSAQCFARSRSRIAVVELELARSARTGARGSPAIVGLDWSSVINDHALALSLSLFPEIL